MKRVLFNEHQLMHDFFHTLIGSLHVAAFTCTTRMINSCSNLAQKVSHLLNKANVYKTGVVETIIVIELLCYICHNGICIIIIGQSLFSVISFTFFTYVNDRRNLKLN